ncbi:MAG: PEP-CTERM sorting domain-containing protein [Verrucomicrobia bacterium]|nr:PEP-CTERM sorting domain-containing protein [Verrucomicrobiota bacterium]MCH8528083.1 PEP-CTERM sorting domain-containing protein [Kiritimatiellia bacterium]
MKTHTIPALLATAMLGFSLTANASPIYSETFDNNTGSGFALENVDWKANHAANALVFDSSTTGGGRPAVSSDVGSDGTNGFVFHGSYGRDQPWIWWTDVQSFGDVGDLESVGFALRNDNHQENIRVALSVGTDWYVSDSVFNTPGNPNWVTHSLDVANSSFRTLSFTSGSTLGNPGAVTALPGSGTVTAIGFYTENLLSTVRFDTVTVIPEPGTLALVGLALAACVLGRRRLRK